MAAPAPTVARPPLRVLGAFLLLAAASASTQPAPAQECLDVVGRWGGDRRVTRIAADGDRVVLAAGANLVVGTVASDGTIVDQGTLALQNEPLLSVAGDLAVVAFGETRAWLVDISEPDRPRIAGRVPGLTGAASVDIAGSTVLVADYPVGLAVVDASDPAVPVVTRLTLPGARQVAFAGDRAVVVATEEHDDGSVTETLHVVDPSGMAPAVLGSCSLSSRYALLAATARWAYVAWCASNYPYPCTVQRVFLDDPTAPVPGPGQPVWRPEDMIAVEDLVLVAGSAGLLVYDEVLNLLGYHPGHTTGYGVASAGAWTLVSGPTGVLSVSLDDPSRPRTVATRPNDDAHFVKDAGIVGDQVVLVDSPSPHLVDLTLRVLDLAEPARPLERGSLPLASGLGRLAVARNVAVVLEGGTLRVVDLADPSQPRWAGELTFEGRPRSIAATEQLAMVADDSPAVHFVDLSYLPQPQVVSSFAISSTWSQVSFDGPRGLVNERNSGVPSTLRVFDLSDEDLPLVTTISWAQASLVGAWDGMLFAAGGSLEIWDVDQPTALATFGADRYITGVAAGGGWAFAAQREDFHGPPLSGITYHLDRLTALRVGREPHGALEGPTITATGLQARVLIRGEHLLIPSGSGGLAVVEVGACETLPPEARFEWWPQVAAAGQDVRFRDLSIGLPSSVLWSFGDGSTSDDPSPTHVFATAGRYPVTLQVTNHVGTDAVTMEVVVGGVRSARGRVGAP